MGRQARLCIMLIVLSLAFCSHGYARTAGKKPGPETNNRFLCGTTVNNAAFFRSQLLHAINVARPIRTRAGGILQVSRVGDVAVMVDDGSLILKKGSFPFDLDNRTLHFAPNALGGYDITTKTLSFDTNLGTNLQAGDDTNHQVAFSGGFQFVYEDTTWNSVWVVSNGGVRFESPGTSGSFNIDDFGAEQSMIAALFADLNPASGGGVFFRQDADKFVVTWSNVPEFNTTNSNTVQLTLFASGAFEVSFNGVGISMPANNQPMFVGFNSSFPIPAFRAVDFSNTPIMGASGTKIFEAFQQRTDLEVDNVGVANAFYGSFPDIFDQIVLLTTFQYSLLGTGAFAFHIPVKNDIMGIGRPLADHTVFYGSAGRLQSFLSVNALSVWPVDPNSRFLANGYNFLGILGEESGHRWGSAVSFDIGSGPQKLLLGRSLNHWSRYLDSDGSVMEGNNWRKLSANQFQVSGFVGGYSHLDHYLMGLRAPEEVEPFFYISSSANNQLSNRAKGVALPGANASGAQTWVSVQDIIRAEGLRTPGRDVAQKDFHQAFVLLAPPGEPPSNAEVNKLAGFIAAWKPYFLQSTDARASMATDLAQDLPVAAIHGHVREAGSGSPVANLTVKVPDLGVVQSVSQGGYYSIRLRDPGGGGGSETHTVITEADSFISRSDLLVFTYGNEVTRDVDLQPLFAPNIMVSPTTLDFGNVAVNASLTKSLVVKNSGNKTLIVSGISSDNSAFTAVPASFSLAAGATDSAAVTFLPTRTGAFNGTLTVDSNDPGNPSVAVTLLGGGSAGPPAISVSPTTLSATLAPGDTARQSVTVRNDGGSDLVYSVTAFDGGGAPQWLRLSKTGGTIVAGAEDQVDVTFDAAGLSPAQFNANVLIDSNDPNRARVSLPAALTVVALPAIEVTPSFLSLRVEEGDVVTDTLFIRNAGGGQLDFSISAGGIIKVSPNADAATANETKLISLSVDATGLTRGFLNDTLSIASNDPMRPLVLVPGAIEITPPVSVELPEPLPGDFALKQNYPNPFNPSTVISYTLPKRSHVVLEVFNVTGGKVATLANGEQGAGNHSVAWKGANDVGASVSSGVYVYRLVASSDSKVFAASHKMIYFK